MVSPSRPRSHNAVTIALVASMIGLVVPAIPLHIAPSAFSPSTPFVPPSERGNCTYIGYVTLDTPHGVNDTHYFKCSGAPIVTSNQTSSEIVSSLGTPRSVGFTSTADRKSGSDPSGNMNYMIGWSSGFCATASGNYCADTQVGESTLMQPNTNYWSIQDNVYAGLCATNAISYQNSPVIGTYANSWGNYWYDGIVTYHYCLYSSYSYNSYNILSGTNLNWNTVFETWYTLGSGGYPTTAWLTVSPPSGGSYTYSAAIPNNPNTGPTGWEQNIVCSNGGCYTTFAGGIGWVNYYQTNMKVSNPSSTSYTLENSNCNYSTVSLNAAGNQGTQTYTC